MSDTSSEPSKNESYKKRFHSIEAILGFYLTPILLILIIVVLGIWFLGFDPVTFILSLSEVNIFILPAIQLVIIWLGAFYTRRILSAIIRIVTTRLRWANEKVIYNLQQLFGFSVIVVGIIWSLSLVENLQNWIDFVTVFSPTLPTIYSIIIVLGALYLSRILVEVEKEVFRRTPGISREMNILFRNFTRYGIAAVAIIWIFIAFNVITELQGLLTAAGFFGIVIGLAAQQTLSNTLAALTLILDRPFRIGDWIKLGNMDVSGKVKSMNLRSTTLISASNTPINVPNTVIAQEPIINFTLYRQRRLFFKIGIAYKSDIANAIQAIKTVLDSDPATTEKGIRGQGYFSPAEVVIKDFQDSSIELEAKVFVDTKYETGLLETRSRILSGILKELTNAKIEIPYPIQEIFLHENSSKDQSKS